MGLLNGSFGLKFSVGDESRLTSRCLSKTVGSIIERCRIPCAEVVIRPGIVESGAEEYRLPPLLPSMLRFFALRLPDLLIHELGELKFMDKDRRARF